MKRSYTIIELLVTICIIVLLIAIIIPSLSKARESARSVQCLNNIRQLVLASNSYYNDYKTHPAVLSTFRFAEIINDGGYINEIASEEKPQQPWACLSDTEFKNNQGFSYNYAPYILIGVDARTYFSLKYQDPIILFKESSIHSRIIDSDGKIK